jgi:hypothetical protein
MLLEDRFQKIWVPSWENRDLRQLLWHRHRMCGRRTRIMNQLQAVALNEGLRCKKRLWREHGRQQLESFRLALWASRRRRDLLKLLDRLTPDDHASSFSVSGSDILSHVERMTVCPGDLFDHLFRTVTKFKLADGSTLILAVFGPVEASNSGQPPQIATADWLEELAVYGTARNLRDQELAYQLSLAIENLYLVRLALRQSDKPNRRRALM